MQKNVPLVKQNVMKLEVFIRIDQKRKKGWGEGEERGSRKGAERGRDREKRDKRELS